MKPTTPGLFLIYLPLRSIFPLHLFSDQLNQKYKNTLLHFILFLIYLSIYYKFTSRPFAYLEAPYPKGIDNPFTHRVARCCYLCAGAVYVVLFGSPTGSITLVSFLRKIPTAAMLHHPFLFGEIPTYLQATSKGISDAVAGEDLQHIPGS